MATINPYQAPQARVADVGPVTGELALAQRSTRLAAVLLDGLLFAVFGIIAAIIIPMYAEKGAAGGDQATAVMVMVMGLGIVVLLIMNMIFLHRYGQTIGKRILKIKIVRSNGERAGLARIFFLRWLVTGLLGAIPLVGYVVSVVDSLLIFRDSRKCLHDNIADTIVIKA